MKRSTYAFTIIGLSFLSVLAVSCGSGGSRNDQGSSFLAFGYFADTTGEVGETGAILPMFTDFSVSGSDGLQRITYMGLRNLMTRQFVRVVRVDCDYQVEGSFIKLPSDSFGFSTVLGPVPDAATGGEGEPIAQIAYSGFQVLSPDLYSFLNNNRSLLPELPYRMVATCAATGVTQSGTTMTTNSLNYFIQFVEPSECCTGAENDQIPDFQQGAGTGGTLVTEPSEPGVNDAGINGATVTSTTSTDLSEITFTDDTSEITVTDVEQLTVTDQLN